MIMMGRGMVNRFLDSSCTGCRLNRSSVFGNGIKDSALVNTKRTDILAKNGIVFHVVKRVCSGHSLTVGLNPAKC